MTRKPFPSHDNGVVKSSKLNGDWPEKYIVDKSPPKIRNAPKQKSMFPPEFALFIKSVIALPGCAAVVDSPVIGMLCLVLLAI